MDTVTQQPAPVVVNKVPVWGWIAMAIGFIAVLIAIFFLITTLFFGGWLYHEKTKAPTGQLGKVNGKEQTITGNETSKQLQPQLQSKQEITKDGVGDGSGFPSTDADPNKKDVKLVASNFIVTSPNYKKAYELPTSMTGLIGVAYMYGSICPFVANDLIDDYDKDWGSPKDNDTTFIRGDVTYENKKNEDISGWDNNVEVTVENGYSYIKGVDIKSSDMVDGSMGYTWGMELWKRGGWFVDLLKHNTEAYKQFKDFIIPNGQNGHNFRFIIMTRADWDKLQQDLQKDKIAS